MRSVSTRLRHGAVLLAVVALLAVPVLHADDLDPSQPPEARIRPPGGVTSQAKIRPPIGFDELLLLVLQWAMIAPIG